MRKQKNRSSLTDYSVALVVFTVLVLQGYAGAQDKSLPGPKLQAEGGKKGLIFRTKKEILEETEMDTRE
jgi:hypothetical protein